MHRALDAVEALGTTFNHILVDGDKFKPYISKTSMNWTPFTCEVEGDARFLNIAAASILAKTYRDNYIIELMKHEPNIEEKYSFTQNKGYGTAVHMTGLKTYGACQYHRQSFAPMKNYGPRA
jgi:ribonuclease HII